MNLNSISGKNWIFKKFEQNDIRQICEKHNISEINAKLLAIRKKNIQDMTNLCIKHLENRNFFKPLEKKPIMLENLRSIFYKMQLSEKETRILSSVFASLAKKGRLTK